MLTAAPPDKADASVAGVTVRETIAILTRLGFDQFRVASEDWGAVIAYAAGLPGIRGFSHDRHFSGSSDTAAGMMPVADRVAGVLAFRRS